jgi:hypothetical protein
MHPLLNHFEFGIFNAIQCRIRFCFYTCLNKRVAGEFFLFFFVDETQIKRSDFMPRTLTFFHSFNMICNADDLQS